jgi:hypothetical protein
MPVLVLGWVAAAASASAADDHEPPLQVVLQIGLTDWVNSAA